MNYYAKVDAFYKTLPKTKKHAIACGAKWYFTSKPCKRGHVAPRALSGGCIRCSALWATKKAIRNAKPNYMTKIDDKLLGRSIDKVIVDEYYAFDD